MDWWIDLLKEWDGIRLIKDSRGSLELWTDAATSTFGLGAHLGPPDKPTAAFISTFNKGRPTTDIMFLEALAVLQSLELWKDTLYEHDLMVHVNNQALCAALRSGSIRHRPTQAVIRRIFAYRSSLRLSSLTPIWIPSEVNVLADALSRHDLTFARLHAPNIDSILTYDSPQPILSPPPESPTDPTLDSIPDIVDIPYLSLSPLDPLSLSFD